MSFEPMRFELVRFEEPVQVEAGKAYMVDYPAITMYRVDPDAFVRRLNATGWFTPITVRGTVKLTPLGFRTLFGRSHPRIRRMHAAYSRRRGRGRW